MPTKIQYPSRTDDSDRTALIAESPPKRRRPPKCSRHGERLTELEDVADLQIDKGMTYRLANPEDTRIAYCESCADETRNYAHDLRDKTDRELVIHRIEQHFSGDLRAGAGGFRELFEPASVSVGDGLSHCPFCGSEVDVKNRDLGRCVCPEHGDLHLSVKQLDA